MKIAKVWKNDYPWDIRVEKMCNSLIDDGHEVHLICSNTRREKTEENLNGLKIHRLGFFRNRVLNTLYSMPMFFNPFWILKILSVVKKEKIKVIIVRDLPLVLAGILVARICKVSVILDMAENYPALWKDHVSRRGKKFYNHLLKNPALATATENYALRHVDHVITVVEESRNRIIKKGIPKDKISIVSNTPDLRMFDLSKSSVSIPKMADGFKLLYVGFITMSRGIDTVIKSIPLLTKQIPDLRFIIVGNGKYLDEIKIMVDELGISENVEFCGWVSFDEVPAYIRSSEICIVPHDITDHVNSTIPNKLFDYMASKKPVIVSDAVPLKRIVEETNCGVVFSAKDPTSFAEKVLALRKSKARNELGENGYTAVHKTYNWSKDAQRLKDVFNKIEKPYEDYKSGVLADNKKYGDN